jgi:hypothetical protein
MIEGGCFCKRVRYAIDDGQYICANCHCTMCRRAHAAPYVTWLVVPVERLRYTAHAPTQFASSDDGTRFFCSTCGTHVACVNTSHPEVVDVTVGSLDAPAAFAPTLDVYTDTRLPWVTSTAGMP